MMCAMREENEPPSPQGDEREGAGLLSNLPRTRPQRSSARRIAARDGNSGGAAHRSGARQTVRKQADGATATAAAASPRASAGTTGKPRKPKAKQAAGARSRAATPGRARARTAADARARRAQDRAPRQGFESEAETASGPVMPPGATELVSAAGELLTGVAKSGLSRGASTLKGIAGRLGLR